MDHELPRWLIWRQRPFPDANLLLVDGRELALVDSGFVGHADETAAWVNAHTTYSGRCAGSAPETLQVDRRGCVVGL